MSLNLESIKLINPNEQIKETTPWYIMLVIGSWISHFHIFLATKCSHTISRNAFHKQRHIESDYTSTSTRQASVHNN